MDKQNSRWKILRVLTTDQCNYECIYCHNEGQEEKGKEKMMTLNDFIRYYKIAMKVGVQEVRFSGGEPLVNGETIEMIEWLDNNSDVEIGLATNGSLVTEEIACRLGNTRTMVTVHFPGVGRENYYAVTKRNWNLFEKCIKLFEKYNVDYSFNFTLYPRIVDAIDEVINYTVKKGKRIKLLPFLDSGFNNYSTEIMKEIIDKLNNLYSDFVYYKEEGVYLWTVNTGAVIKMIDSPCYGKNIELCKKYGEIRLLPDLSMVNCIFGKKRSTKNKTDEEIFRMFNAMWDEMSSCEKVSIMRNEII